MKPHSLLQRTCSLFLIAAFVSVTTLKGQAFASQGSSTPKSAASSAGIPAQSILESFHSDLATGRAVFGIPIAVPPGRRGVQPALGLNYSSSTKNGPIGVGWNLELGVIERSTRFGLPSFDSSDTFSLRYGGVTSDLVEISPGEFRPKNDQPFTKILFDSNQWQIISKDGSTTTFGGTPQAQLTVTRGTVRWLLNQAQDIHGNTITVSYTFHNGQIYPNLIEYTAHPATNLAPAHEIRFLWESRPDIEWDMRFGKKIATAQRLSAVEAYTNSSLVRRYTFAYTPSPITDRSLLATVTTVGADGATSLPPIRLTYTDTFSEWMATPAWRTTPETGIFNFLDTQYRDTGFRLVEVTGDGKTDLLQAKDGTYRSWSNNNGWTLDNRWAPPKPFVVNQHEDAGARFADLNGDGLTDIYYGWSADPSGDSEAGYINTGSGWQRNNSWNSAVGWGGVRFTYTQSKDSGMRYADLNGDGKTDLLLGQGNSMKSWRNSGYGWRMDDRWAPPHPFVTTDWKNAGCRLTDLNGDGLTDLIYAGPEARTAYLNTGSGWRQETAFNSGPLSGVDFVTSDGKDTGWRFVDVNGDGLPDAVKAKEGSAFEVHLNTGTGWSTDNRFIPPYPFTSSSNLDWGARFSDINGDGLTDLAYGRETGIQMGYLWASQANTTPATPPDLMRVVDNGIGGTTTLTYLPSTHYDNTGQDSQPDLPFVTQTVTSRTISNGFGWSAATQYAYAGGAFDPEEREFLGFAHATVTDPEGSTAQTWFHQDLHTKGRPYKSETKDAQGNLYLRKENSWTCADLFPGAPSHIHFCHLTETTSTLFDGDETSKQTRASFTYDDSGHVVKKIQHGDTSITEDDITTTIEYTENPALWLMGFPSHILTTDAGGAKLAESWIFYDNNTSHTDPPTRGLATQSEAWLSTGPPNPTTSSTYDLYGNKLTSTDTLGRTTTTAYDPGTHTFPVSVTNILGHTLSTTYDPGTGSILSTTDPNNQTTQNRYDALGRLTSVIGPEDTEEHPSVRYEYDPFVIPTRTTKETKASVDEYGYDAADYDYGDPYADPYDDPYDDPYADTYDDPYSDPYSDPYEDTYGGPTPTYYTVHTFVDGMGRTIQTRTQADDPSQQIISGTVTFNARGQVAAQYLPYFAPAVNYCALPPPTLPKTTYEYDAMGRNIRVTQPDGAVTQTAYDDWTVTFTDPNGNTTIRRSDAYGRLTQITEPATDDHPASITTYAYDTAGRLTQVTDANGNTNQMTYDSLGRKLTMTDPDMGHWSYSYDLAGNLITQTDAKGQLLEFTYDDLNRLIEKKGSDPEGGLTPTGPVTLAAYTYDAPAKPNCVGRLSRVDDTSGSTEFFYDLLGRETQTTKTIDGSSFTVSRSYDPLNRLTTLTYPDGLEVSYDYSPQGINRVTGSLDDGYTTFDILTDASYNAAGEPLALNFGNGTTTDYTYDPNTLRIDSIRTTNPSAQLLQDLSYDFDAVGNLTSLTDHWNTASQTFQYDEINRLTTASGAYGSFYYSFDATGNLLEKGTSTTLTYGAPDGTKPHAVTTFNDGSTNLTLTYDDNGNLIEKTGSDPEGGLTPTGTTTYTYDLQNRLTQVTTPGGQSTEITLTLQPGWNCVGFPFQFADSSITSVLSDLAVGTDYDQVSLLTPSVIPAEAGTSPWQSFVGDPDANETAALNFGRGFWVNLTTAEPREITISGSAPGSRRTLSLTEGWNLISSPRFTETTVQQALEGLTEGMDYYDVMRWNPDYQSFEPVYDTVQPGDALWVNMTQALDWEYPTPTAQVTTTFTYDGDGGRVRLETDSGQRTTFVGELYEVIPGGTSKSHIFLGPTRISTLSQTPMLMARKGSDPAWGLTPIRTVLASVKRFFRGVEELFVGRAYAEPLPSGMSLSFYHGDHLGSVNVITNDLGQQIKLQEYSPFGAASRIEGSDPANSSLRGSEATEAISGFAFTGQRLDSTTGLYYFHARYYDPELGRFTQPDTIVQAPSDPQSLNRYSYCRNNPIKFVDPTGHFFSKIFRKIAKALGKIGRMIVSAVVAVAVAIVVTPIAGPQAGFAAAAATFSFTNTFLTGMANGASFGRSLGAAATAGAISGAGAYFAWGAGGLAGAAIGAAAGAAQGAATSAILGGSPGRGALSGAVGGAIMGGAAGLKLGTIGLVAAAAGAGAASAAVANQDPGEGAYLGAIGAASFAVASASLQAAFDIMRGEVGAGAEGDADVANSFSGQGRRVMRPMGIEGSRAEVSRALQARSALSVNQNGGKVVMGPDGNQYWVPDYNPSTVPIGQRIGKILFNLLWNWLTPPLTPNPHPDPGREPPTPIALNLLDWLLRTDKLKTMVA